MNTLEIFQQYLAERMSAASANQILGITDKIDLKDSEVFVSQGQTTNKLFFIPQGIVRYFVVNQKGQEANKTFTQAPCIVGSTTALVDARASGINIAVFQAAQALTIDWQGLRELMAESHEIERFYRIGLERLFIMKELRESSLLLESAEERYLDFLATHEDIKDMVPQYHIASYLGISPVSLSRIRKHLD